MKPTTVSIAQLLTKPTSGERSRQRINLTMSSLVGVAAFLAILPLAALILFVLLKAVPFLVPSFFFNNPLDQEPGILNAIVGSLQLSGLTVLISGPIGIAGGVYLSEFASPRVVAIGETAIDVLLEFQASLLVCLPTSSWCPFSASQVGRPLLRSPS